MSSVLDPLLGQHSEMAAAAATVRTLALLLPDISLPAGVPDLAAAETRVAAGIPALEGESLLSGSGLLANIRFVSEALERTAAREAVAGLPEALEQSVSEAEADGLASLAQAGIWSMLAALAERIEVDSDALISLADYAVRPALRSGARAVQQLVAQSRWNRGTCPGCGAAPLLAELRGGGASKGAEQERALRCGRCLTAWSLPRLRCVACGETNHQRLAYLHGTGEAAFRRVDVCSTCYSYLKSIAVLAPLSLAELIEMDLATAALDFGAVERGFHR